MKSKYYVVTGLIVLVVAIGFLIPLGSYTTTKGCPINPTPEKRLSVIKGDSLEKVKSSDESYSPSPTEGCSANIKFTLYFL